MTDRVRFQADANFNAFIIRGLLRRQPLIDVQTAEQAQLQGIDDVHVLALAASAGRILVSHDYHTMPEHSAAFLAGGQRSPGVMPLHQHFLLRRPLRRCCCCGRQVRPMNGKIH